MKVKNSLNVLPSRSDSLFLGENILDGLIGQQGFDTLAVLKYLSDYPSEVSPYIHDLWCEQYSRLGYYYSETPSIDGRATPFLKPLSEFSASELDFELGLAALDMQSIATGLKTRIPSYVRRHPACSSREFLYSVDFRGVVSLILSLAEDQQFLEQIAPEIHRNWQAMCMQIGRDDALQLQMTPERYDDMLRNVWCDVTAVALFCENQR